MEDLFSSVIPSVIFQWIFKRPHCKPLENDQLENLQVSAWPRFSKSQASLRTSLLFLTRVKRLVDHKIVVSLDCNKMKLSLDILIVKMITWGESEYSLINVCIIQIVVIVDLCHLERRFWYHTKVHKHFFPI